MNEAAAALGRKGGEAGKGGSKRRGDAAYYRALVLKRQRCGRDLPDGTYCVRYVVHPGQCSAEPRTLPPMMATSRYYVDPVRG